MLVRDVGGVEWGMFALMGGVEKAQRFATHFQYMFFVVCGWAYLTFGDHFKAPETKVLLAQAILPRYRATMTTASRMPTPRPPQPFLFYKTRGPVSVTSVGAGLSEEGELKIFFFERS